MESSHTPLARSMPALSTGSAGEMGLYELLATLPAQLQPHVNSQEDLTFLWDMFGEKSLHSLVKIHEKLHYYEKQSPVPILHRAAALADDLAEELQNKPLSSEMRELLKLLSKPNVKVRAPASSQRVLLRGLVIKALCACISTYMLLQIV